MSLVPYHDRDGWIWMDGQFVPWRECKVHVLTHGLHYASAVFEGERAYDGVIFKSREHTERLHRSAELLDFTVPFSVDEIEAAKAETIVRMGYSDCYVRPIAWRGSEMMGVSAQNNVIHLAIACWLWGDYFKNKMQGIRLTHAKWRRPDPATAPCSSKAAGLYMICTMSKHAAEREGYADALMLDWRGRVAEATGANVFFVRDGVIYTPTPDCFLDGITRRSVIALATRAGYEVVEKTIMPEDLNTFSECFLTGTAAEVTPVSEIGQHRYTPGPVCERLLADFADVVRRKGAFAHQTLEIGAPA
jgi:branched-chain amino acid aminotransferase